MLKVNILPRLETVANDMGDLFVPVLARNEIVVRRGKIKTRSEGIKEVIMGAYAPVPAGNLNLLVITQDEAGVWETNTSFDSGSVFDEVTAAVNSLK